MYARRPWRLKRINLATINPKKRIKFMRQIQHERVDRQWPSEPETINRTKPDDMSPKVRSSMSKIDYIKIMAVLGLLGVQPLPTGSALPGSRQRTVSLRRFRADSFSLSMSAGDRQ